MTLIPHEERLRRWREHEANKKKPGRPRKNGTTAKAEPYEKLYDSEGNPEFLQRFKSESNEPENESAHAIEASQEPAEDSETTETAAAPITEKSDSEKALEVAARAASRIQNQNHRSAGPPESAAEKWYPSVTDFMARNADMSLRTAVKICANLDLSANEETMHWRRRTFQKMLLSSRGHYYASLGKDPIKSKNAIVGRMMWLVDKLVEAGEFEKAGELLFKVGKAEGYIGPEVQMNNFYGVTDQEIEAARRNLLEEIGAVDGKIGSA